MEFSGAEAVGAAAGVPNINPELAGVAAVVVDVAPKAEMNKQMISKIAKEFVNTYDWWMLYHRMKIDLYLRTCYLFVNMSKFSLKRK